MRGIMLGFAIGTVVLAAPIVPGVSSSEVQAEEKPTVIIDTSLGAIEVQLEPSKAPETVKNFLAYVDAHFYDGTIFHRVIKNFMIQGGGLTPDLQPKKTNAPIKIESKNGLKNLRGTIAMARTGDPNSATSQFFISHIDNDFLDYKDDTIRGAGYTVFGKVTSGMDVVDKIATTKTGMRAGYQDVPVENVVIKSIKGKVVK